MAFLSLYLWYALPLAFPLNHTVLDNPPPSVLILDRYGIPLHHQTRDDYYRSLKSPLDQIPQQLIEATLAAEDKRFYTHGGVDIFATVRALKDSWDAGRFVSGASTVTQQTVKLSMGSPPRTLETKCIEALTARHLEMQYTKDEILAAYFNQLDYGNLTQGPRQAALHYFGKELNQLSLAESALLAGLPQAPSRHNPRRNPNNAKQRRDWVLDRMAAVYNYPSEQIKRAKSEPIQLVSRHSHATSPHLAQQVLKHRHHGSSTIQTTIDGSLQSKAQRILTQEIEKLTSHHVKNGAVVIIDNATREVLTLIGTANFDEGDTGQINAALVPRSPGSALKPFTYLLAFEKLDYSPATIIPDIPTQYSGVRGPESFLNYDRTYRGPVTIYHSLGNSLNVPAVRVLNQLGGAEPLKKNLEKLGITTLNQPALHYGLGLTLGSGEVTLLEASNAFATISQQGLHRRYSLVQSLQVQPSKRVLSEESCFLISSILSSNLARSATFGAQSHLRLPFECSVKTGTSSDFRDNFCIGFTTDYTVGVWVGNLTNEPMKGVSGVTGAGAVFNKVMRYLHRNHPPTPVRKPTNIASIHIDPLTGKRLHEQHPRRANALQTHAHKDNQPPLARDSDYNESGKVYLDAEYYDWLDGRDTQLFVATDTRDSDIPFRVLSPALDATYLLDPDLPDRGAYLSLLSSHDAKHIEWECTTLTIIEQHNTPTLVLVPGEHEVTAKHKISQQTITIKFSVKEL